MSGWSKESLIERANIWTEKKNYQMISKDSFKNWRKQGLLPAPKPKGRGRGLGKAEEWSTIAYFRLLKILKLRANGITHRREQRLILWFQGHDIPIKFIREDLKETYLSAIKKSNREAKTEYWNAPKDDVPKQAFRFGGRIFPEFADGSSFTHFIQCFEECLPGNEEFILKKVKNIMIGVLYSFFNPNYNGFQNEVSSHLTQFANLFDMSEKNIVSELKTAQGLLASADEYENNLLEAFNQIPDDTFIFIRNFTLIAGEIFRETINLFIEILENDKSFLGPFSFLNGSVVNIIKKIRPLNIQLTPSNKWMIFMFLLKRSFENGNDGKALDQLAQMRLDKLLSWSGKNLSLLLKPNNTESEVLQLVEKSELPDSLKTLLIKGIYQ